jgi:hypothetical protein
MEPHSNKFFHFPCSAGETMHQPTPPTHSPSTIFSESFLSQNANEIVVRSTNV